MSWFSKFFHLLYIAYLDCEESLRVLAYLTIGVVMGYVSVLFAVEYLPPDYTLLAMVLISLSMWNLGIILILAFQYLVSAIIGYSMIKVAYIYDNQSWGYVHALNGAGTTIGTQLDIDKALKIEQQKQHEVMLKEKIGKLKES